MFPLFVLLGCLGLLYFYLVKNFDYWKKRNVPGPKPKLFVGNFPSIYNRKISYSDELQEMYNAYKGKSPVIGIFRGVEPSVMVIDPKVVKQVFVTNFSHFVNQHIFAAVSGSRN